MRELGQCLLFYLKHAPEMERLYDAEEPNIDGLPNPDEVLRRVTLVGDTGSQQAAQFLEACASEVEAQLSSITPLERIRNNLADSWELKYRIPPKQVKKKRFEIGVSIGHMNAAVLPWIWCAGNRRTEDEIIRLLGCGTKTTAINLDWYTGTVILAQIPIAIPEPLTTPVPYDHFLPQVRTAFSCITSEKIPQLISLAEGL